MSKRRANYQTSVKSLLPEEFLLDLGVFLQTCAYIEQTAAILIASLNVDDPESESFFAEYESYRKLSTKELLKTLRSVTDKAEQFGFADRLSEISNAIEINNEKRHLAVHGAFIATPNDFLRVDHLKNWGQGLEQNRTAITKQDVCIAIRDADFILTVLIGFIEAVQPRLYVDTSHRAFPIVTHPFSKRK